MAPATGINVVPVGQVALPGQCHAVLDSVENFDADSVEGSNDTYDFAGMDVKQPELLYTRTYPCVCKAAPGSAEVGKEPAWHP